MFLNLFLFYQVVRPLGHKSVNKYLYLYYCWLGITYFCLTSILQVMSYSLADRNMVIQFQL